jgi:hypothetical protein
MSACPNHFVGSEHLRCLTCGGTDAFPPPDPDSAPSFDEIEAAGLDATLRTVGRRVGRIVATDRDESESCERLTPGCSIDHTAESYDGRLVDGSCETW